LIVTRVPRSVRLPAAAIRGTRLAHRDAGQAGTAPGNVVIHTASSPPAAPAPRTRRPRAWLTLALPAIAAGCALLDGPSLDRTALERMASAHGFVVESLDTGPFVLTVAHRGLAAPGARPPEEVAVVYVEGDGRGWRRRRIPHDPTPRDPVALRMALRDPRPAVLWLARPCQFTASAGARTCAPRYWASHRFAPEVVAALNDAVDARAGGRRIGLVGYSGGAAIAVLIAARRDDVAWLATVAGNLDHAAWTRHHGVTPLTGSLNPADAAAALAGTRQVHIVGGRDDVVPRPVTDAFLARMGPADGVPDRVPDHVPDHAVVHEVADADHRCCWVERWPQVLCDAAPGLAPACPR